MHIAYIIKRSHTETEKGNVFPLAGYKEMFMSVNFTFSLNITNWKVAFFYDAAGNMNYVQVNFSFSCKAHRNI